MTTIIYVDTLFALNFLIDYLLLLASAKLAGRTFKRWRLALSALVGGVYAVLVYIPGLSFLSGFLVKLGVAALMVIIAFGVNKNTLRQGVVFLCVSFALGGGVMAVWFFMQGINGVSLISGIPYIHIDVKLLILVSAGVYAVLAMVFKGISAARAKGSIARVHIKNSGWEVKLSALKDSGNSLKDPFTGAPVLVIELDDAKRLIGPEISPLLTEQSLHDPYRLIEDAALVSGKPLLRPIPYRSVGSDGTLVAFKPDYISVDGKESSSSLVAVSPTDISDGTGYCAIVGVSEDLSSHGKGMDN